MESKDNTDQIAREFFVKMAQVVISSRLSTSQAPFRKGKPNKWFNLSLDELDNVSEELLGWRLNPRTPLQLDIGWHPSSTSSSSSSSGMTLLERWHVSYQPLQPLQAPGTTDGGSEIPTLYKKLVVALRSVYLLLRLLPASSLARYARVCRLTVHSLASLSCASTSIVFAHAHLFAHLQPSLAHRHVFCWCMRVCVRVCMSGSAAAAATAMGSGVNEVA
eukprot:TRINITY_DN645_c0_g1_i3.p1 TRINITY_DN645_c0_g1~~TRINITY_DN645_c0_g1_i3.p1  ORF type:complete len:219 (+),score=46.93 TRINITY_DN645_c0_g1_i3:780-1436(+)